MNRLRDKGIGIVLTDHNVRDTFKVVNRAYIIDEGEILIEGTPAVVAADGRARERFLGKGFELGEEVRPLVLVAEEPVPERLPEEEIEQEEIEDEERPEIGQQAGRGLPEHLEQRHVHRSRRDPQ